MLEHPKACDTTNVKDSHDNTMGNQQEIFNQADFAWLAGIIEGEGTIAMNARKKQWKGWKGFGVDLQIYITNSDAGIIEKSVNVLRSIGIEPLISERDSVPIRKENGGFYNSCKTIMVVNVNRMSDIAKVLISIIPFMAGEKTSRARLMLKYIERRMSRQGQRSSGGYSWGDNDDWKMVIDFYALQGKEFRPEVKEFLNEHTRLNHKVE